MRFLLLTMAFLLPAPLSAQDALPTAAQGSAVRVAVPDLRGKPQRVARQLVRVRDLEPVSGKFYIADHNWRKGIKPEHVMMQTPHPSTPVSAGSVVALWTFVKASSAQKVIKMPDLRGMSHAEVVSKLQELNLPLMSAKASEPKRDESGRVKDQYPKPDQRILTGTSVFVTF